MNTKAFINYILQNFFQTNIMPYNFNILEEQQGNIVENSHTNILVKLLEYNNCFGYIFLQTFCDRFFNIFTSHIKAGNVVFKTESPLISNNNERIDGLIYSKDNFAIIIENKINGANNMPAQLERYIKDVKNNPKIFTQPNNDYDKIYVVFLTKEGLEMPDQQSIKFLVKNFGCFGNVNGITGPRYVAINYRDDILVWLKDDVKTMVPCSDIVLYSGIVQYIDYLERMFNYCSKNALSNAIDNLLQSEINKINKVCKKNKALVELYEEVNKKRKQLTANQNIERVILTELKNSINRLNRKLISDFITVSCEFFEGRYTNCTKLFNSTFVQNCLDFRYVFFTDAAWPKSIHFEWFPLRDKLCKSNEYTLCFHIEDNRLRNLFLNSSKIVSLLNNLGFTKVNNHGFSYSKTIILSKPILLMSYINLQTELINKAYKPNITIYVVDEINNILKQHKIIP